MVYSFSQKGGDGDGEVCPDHSLDRVGATPGSPGGGSRRDRDGACAATLVAAWRVPGSAKSNPGLFYFVYLNLCRDVIAPLSIFSNSLGKLC